MKAALSITVLSVALAGCVAPAPPIAIPGIEQSASISLVDLRPPKEREATQFSLVVTNDAYGTSRVGDDPVKPPPLRVLQHRYYERFGSRKSGTIEVNHFVIYKNLKSWGRAVGIGGALAGAGGAVAAVNASTKRVAELSSALSPAAFDVGADEWKLALFTSAEDQGPVVSYIVYIDTKVDGKRIATKTIYPTTEDNSNLAIPRAVEAAIAFHLSEHAK